MGLGLWVDMAVNTFPQEGVVPAPLKEIVVNRDGFRAVLVVWKHRRSPPTLWPPTLAMFA